MPFTRNFDQDLTVTKDPDRAAKLMAEGPGVLRWCVEGARAYQELGLQVPASVRKARDDYKTDMDLLSEWLDECCEVGPNHVSDNGALWASWESFAKARGELRFIASAGWISSPTWRVCAFSSKYSGSKWRRLEVA